MKSAVHFSGLRIDNITPDRYSTGVNVYSQVDMVFNSELNVKTIFGNVFLLHDREKRYIEGECIDISIFDKVEYNVEYKNRTVSLKPSSQFSKSARYIIYVPKNSVEDFKGRVLDKDFIAFFDTEGEFDALDNPCNIIYPQNNSIIKSLDRVEIDNVGAGNYIIQISKNKDFEIGLYETVTSHTNIVDKFNIFDGSYYIRARSTNGIWGETSFFTIHSYESSMISETDFETFQFERVDDETLKVLESFPQIQNNVSVKTNLCYIKINSIIDFENIDFYDSGLFQKHIKDEDFSLDSVDGTFVGIHNEIEKCTYIVFIPDDI